MNQYFGGILWSTSNVVVNLEHLLLINSCFWFALALDVGLCNDDVIVIMLLKKGKDNMIFTSSCSCLNV